MNYIALAIAPGVAICLLIFYSDVYNREPKLNLLVCFILGCASILPALGFETAFRGTMDGTVAGAAIFAYAVVAFSEEFSKFLGVRLYAYNQRSFDEPLDGIVYAVMVSMGFATVENIKYIVQTPAGTELKLGLMRMFTAVPAHATFAVIMGYYVGKAKFDKKSGTTLLLMGLLGAILFHGTYDFFLFVQEYTFVGKQVADGMLVLGALGSFIIALVLSTKLIRRQRGVSFRMFREQKIITTEGGTATEIITTTTTTTSSTPPPPPPPLA